MHQLLYVSHAAPGLAFSDLDKILYAARRSNEAHSLTGFLVHIDGGFLQILEGPRDKVLERFGVIAQDPRHLRPRVLVDRAVERRAFARWAMGYEHLEAGDPPLRGLHGIVRECVAGHLSPGSGRVVATMLETFYRMEMDEPALLPPKSAPAGYCDSLEMLAAR
jgi:hypothetical protein